MSKTNEVTTPIVDSNELSAAEQAAEESTNTFTIRFQEPFTFEGKTYEELTFVWDKLTGKDGLAIENEMQAKGHPVIVPAFSGEYLVRMAARACTTPIGVDVICAMPLSGYNRIRSAARSFLLKSES